MVFGKLKNAAEYPVEKLRIELAKEDVTKLLRSGFYSGLGWAVGVTLGFALVSTIIVFILNQLGGIPFIGSWLASIVQATTDQLSVRTPVAPLSR